MNKKGYGVWWLLLPWALMAQPRNPFMPPPVSDCLTQRESPANWLLKGTVGQAASRHAWVVTPAGQWLRLESRQSLLGGRWRVEQVFEGRLVLKAGPDDPACPAADNTLVLTLGNHKEEKK